MTDFLEKQLAKRKLAGNLRSLRLTRELIDFASNDYLGLARSMVLKSALTQEIEKHEKTLPVGATGSRLLTGNSFYAQELEDRIATFHGYEAGLLFGSGYMANVGLLSAVAKADDTIFFDAHIHASTHDGIRLSKAKAFPFKHNDTTHLEGRLKHSHQGKKFICIESIYSTDGSQAPLKEICQLTTRYGAHLIVDEAHATGIFGPNGRGLVSEHGLVKQLFAQVTTFGKALGVYGAIILGNATLKEYLINFSNASIYTTALPFHLLAAIQCSYKIFPTLEEERLHLHKLIHHFRKEFKTKSLTPIQALKLPGNETVRQAAEQCAKEGFLVSPLMSPTVRRGHEILRICLHAFNTFDELSTLCQEVLGE